MRGTDYYKIGFTSADDVQNRRSQLQTGCPQPLDVVLTAHGDDLLEQQLHRELLQCKTDGGQEWFELTQDQIDKIRGSINERDSDYQVPVNGTAAFDVRPICRRQQHPVTARGEDVFDRAGRPAPFDYPGNQPVFSPVRREHQECLPSVFWKER